MHFVFIFKLQLQYYFPPLVRLEGQTLLSPIKSPVDLRPVYLLPPRLSCKIWHFGGREGLGVVIWQTSCKFSSLDIWCVDMTPWESGQMIKRHMEDSERMSSANVKCPMLLIFPASFKIMHRWQKHVHRVLVNFQAFSHTRAIKLSRFRLMVMCFWSCKINKHSFQCGNLYPPAH